MERNLKSVAEHKFLLIYSKYYCTKLRHKEIGNVGKQNLSQFSLDLVHIDVARNATDDFNLFHDNNNCNQIVNNPFGGPIALGFQLECFIEDYVKQYRQQNNEQETISKYKLNLTGKTIMLTCLFTTHLKLPCQNESIVYKAFPVES